MRGNTAQHQPVESHDTDSDEMVEMFALYSVQHGTLRGNAGQCKAMRGNTR